MEKVKIGVVGCGNISPIYLKNMTTVFDNLEVKAVTDLDAARAQLAAETFGIPVVYGSAEELLRDQDIEIVLNITPPPGHAPVCMAALEAGKSVYVEKPLSVTREDAMKITITAAKKKLLVGGAPDTFLGAGLQTCRKLIDDGLIGEPVACSAFMMSHGWEDRHPDPEFYYKEGGGPMMDMGPYYLTALVSLLGPVESVSGSSRILVSEAHDHVGETARPGDRRGGVHARGGPAELQERRDRHDRHVLRRVGSASSAYRDLRQRGHALRARSEHVRRAGPVFQARRAGLAGSAVMFPLCGKQPRPWAGGYGGRAQNGPKAPSSRGGAGLPRAGRTLRV